MDGVKRRVHFLDEVRGLCIIAMVFYHSFYLLYSSFSVMGAGKLFLFFSPAEPLFAGAFIFISGISCRFSRSNLKRGLRLAGIAVALSIVTAVIMPRMGFSKCEILFGILHLLSCSILIYVPLHRLTDRIRPEWGILICVLLYAFTFNIRQGQLGLFNFIDITLPEKLFSLKFLFPIGITAEDFFSADYFPVFPHIFLFFAGANAGRLEEEGRFPEVFYENRVPFLSFAGRHTLIIYLTHQAAVYLIASLIFKIF